MLSFYHFIKTGTLISKEECDVDTENYLLGLCDLTGELGRKAVNSVIKDNHELTHKIKDMVTEIYGEFLKLNLRNSELRKKSDSIKWNLSKIEEIIYNLQLRK